MSNDKRLSVNEGIYDADREEPPKVIPTLPTTTHRAPRRANRDGHDNVGI